MCSAGVAECKGHISALIVTHRKKNKAKAESGSVCGK